jgi:CheY-like chemotaxis protein
VYNRDPRVIAACPVTFDRLGRTIEAVTEDLSRHGVFVRTGEFLPVGDIVELRIWLPSGEKVEVISRVAHILSESAARAVGRRAGMGFEFLERDPAQREHLREVLEDLIDELTPPPFEVPRQARVLVCDDSPRLLDRIASALQKDFSVQVESSGADAYGLCIRNPPDILLTSDHLAVLDGWALIAALAAARPQLEIHCILMSDDVSDMTRLRAYRLGVSDFVQKPFTDEELRIRLRRYAGHPRPVSERVVLRGNIADLQMGTLLSLLEFERKSGILAILADGHIARVFVSDGRVMRVDGPPGTTAHERLMSLLDWQAGMFEFSSCEVVGVDELGVTAAQALLEHARLRDEQKG